MEKDKVKPRKSPLAIIGFIGVLAILLGILFIILSKGVSFLTPILQQPGPTSTMIQPVERVSDALKQPGILGELKSFEIEAMNFKFTPSQIVVNEGDTVQINFKNSQGMHNFVIDELGINSKTIQAGESEQITFTAKKKGTYTFYCSIGNHRAMGMEGIIIIN